MKYRIAVDEDCPSCGYPELSGAMPDDHESPLLLCRNCGWQKPRRQNYRVDVKLIRPNSRQNRVCFALPLAETPREAVQKVLDYQRSQGEEVEVLRVVWGSKIKLSLKKPQEIRVGAL